MNPSSLRPFGTFQGKENVTLYESALDCVNSAKTTSNDEKNIYFIRGETFLI